MSAANAVRRTEHKIHMAHLSVTHPQQAAKLTLKNKVKRKAQQAVNKAIDKVLK